MDQDLAKEIAREFQAELQDLDGIATATSIFEASRRQFRGVQYASRVAETLANWHLRHVELALVVVDSYICDRHSAGFVVARPIFETAMTLAWLRTSFPSAKEQYPSLLTLIDQELVQLALRTQSPKDSVREKGESQRTALFGEQREFVDEAVAVGSRGLPGLRSRIEMAEKAFREERGQPSRLDESYGYYRVLSSYGHPSGFGSACEVGADGSLREREDPGWDLLPMMIAVRETPLLFLLLVDIAGWDGGAPLAGGFDEAANAMHGCLDEIFQETIPPVLRQYMEESIQGS